VTFSTLIVADVLQRFYVFLLISDYDITVSGSEESYEEHNKSRNNCESYFNECFGSTL
jgi:hypothetical protein